MHYPQAPTPLVFPSDLSLLYSRDMRDIKMKPTKIIGIRALSNEETLAGAGSGQAFFSKLADAVKDVPRDSVVALNFAKVDIVTASFFRSAFRAFRDYARAELRIYPVFTNVNVATREEIGFFAEGSGDVFVLATLGKDGQLKSPLALGRLDEKQSRALRAIANLGEADAGQLREAFPETPVVSSAAWSNRLAVLSAKGLVMERLEGRAKKFKPIIEGLTHGH